MTPRRYRGVILQRAQSVTEYAIVMAALASAFATMTIYLRRSMQAGIKQAADELDLRETVVDGEQKLVVNGENTQAEGVRQETGQHRRSGRLVASDVQTDTERATAITKTRWTNGTVHTKIDEDRMTTTGILGPGGLVSKQRSTLEKRQ
jgi:hypothetical protein